MSSHRMLLLHPLPFFFFSIRCPPISTLFPYTTLFRSVQVLRNYTPPGQSGPGAEQAVIGSGLKAGEHVVSEGQLRRSESTRLNSSHVSISYAVFCLKKKTTEKN